MNVKKVLTRQEARDKDFVSITRPYNLDCPQERAYLDNVLADMRRGSIDHNPVQIEDNKMEVWRTRDGYKSIAGE